MAKVKRFTEKDGGYHGELGFYCPGCDSIHFINDKETNRDNEPYWSYLKEHNLRLPDVWEFNGDFQNPTIRASVLLTRPDRNFICHSFITDGKIQFLSDCTHELVNQTVELPTI